MWINFNPEINKTLGENFRQMAGKTAVVTKYSRPTGNSKMEGFISPEIFIYFFINSDSTVTQTQILTLKLFPNWTLTQTLT